MSNKCFLTLRQCPNMQIIHSNHPFDLADLISQGLQIDLFWHTLHQHRDTILYHFKRSKCDGDWKQESANWIKNLHFWKQIDNDGEEKYTHWLNIIVVYVYHDCFCVCIFKDVRDVWLIFFKCIFKVSFRNWKFWFPFIIISFFLRLNLWFLVLAQRIQISKIMWMEQSGHHLIENNRNSSCDHHYEAIDLWIIDYSLNCLPT